VLKVCLKANKERYSIKAIDCQSIHGSNLPFRQRTTILCTNSFTVCECTSFCERQSQTTYKAHDTEAYGM